MVRVTMSQVTDSEKPKHSTPQTIISTSSSLSNDCHFRWRCRCSTNLSLMAIVIPGDGGKSTGLPAASRRMRPCGGLMVREARRLRAPHHEGLVHRPDQVLDLLGVRPELL